MGLFFGTEEVLFINNILILINLGNDGAACPLRLNPDRTYIPFVFWQWQYTEDWCSSDCLLYSSANINTTMSWAVLVLLSLLTKLA